MAANHPWSSAYPGRSTNPWESEWNQLSRVLRITGVEYEHEITDLINAACADLGLGGIVPKKLYNNNDPLIRRAIHLYVKANFGLDNPDSEKYAASYDTLKRHLMLSSEYIIEEEDTSSGSSSGSGLSDPTIFDPPGGIERP